ncbi:hypothetical protein [uncultured Algimonas sp.]|uniref:hypothetical protein n=1 Tax=uncultured Algimonas sp. TaxID=1547920 RepID=UPI00260830C9|nr:hypothetical protein [uncultured Algimonas sp.]
MGSLVKSLLRSGRVRFVFDMVLLCTVCGGGIYMLSVDAAADERREAARAVVPIQK